MIYIKLENLKVNMEIKSYKELCEVLDVEVKAGNSKKSQLKWFEEHFTYKKEGNKFIIKEILNKEIQPVPTRGGANNTVEYIENIERLLLDILSQDKINGEIFLSKNKLFHMLEMVNSNYLDYNIRHLKLSKYLNIDEDNVQEWYDSTGGMLERNLNTALKNLANQSLIVWSREITVHKIEVIKGSDYLIEKPHYNQDGEYEPKYEVKVRSRRVTKEATDIEKKIIIKTEREVMDKLECEGKQEVVRRGLWDDFSNTVNNILKKDHKILYYYQSYKVLFNPEHILRKQRQLDEFRLKHKDRVEQKTIVNNSVIERIEDNTNSRQDKAINELGTIVWDCEDDSKSSKMRRRADDSYIQDNTILNNTLINKNAKDIVKEVRMVKVDKK